MADNYHWKSKNVKSCGVDDMVLLTKLDNASIAENLERRLMADAIYTYIGPVLIAVNPFKAIPIYTDREIEMYQGSTSYENPPHVFALCDEIFRNLVNEEESQCCIISGESGAGKTVSAKHVMNYITKVSGGGEHVQTLKDIILQSNPLLEAFGNARTLRNDNSSRFGKYVEILFSRGSAPVGGRITIFLLEKSRVVAQNKGERNFHIFYQALAGLSDEKKRKLGLGGPNDYTYLKQSGCTEIPGINDGEEFQEVNKAMDTVGLSEDVRNSILEMIAGILHLGSVTFTEERNHAHPSDPKSLDLPAKLFQVDKKGLETILITRNMESKWGNTSETIKMEHNSEQASFTRDAISKAIYSRIFSFLVDAVNLAIDNKNAQKSIGILDIYGFEIFQKNGFEQFCINYVNEKLQQIFIELTLKVEQEEYESEGIKWEPIKFFNNKTVCDLIESKKNPVGIMSVLDDVCATMHAKGEGADQKLIEDLSRTVSAHEHFNLSGCGFIINHYAGKVTYDADGFCERNRDQLFTDPIILLQSSKCKFLRELFPEDVNCEKKGRPTTASNKIKTQANALVEKLMKCTPHYIRCIKPNETKKPRDVDLARVKHQIEYLGLKENIRIKRAGFAYRRSFEKFLERYAILTPETYPRWNGSLTDGIKHIMNFANLNQTEWQIGKTKVFIKKPESLFLLEELRERKYNTYAQVIQSIWRRFHNQSVYDAEKALAAKLVLNKKKRFRGSINRKFFGNYICLDDHPELLTFTEKKERVEFSYTVKKYDDKLKPHLADMLVARHIYLIGRERATKGPEKGKVVITLDRKIELTKITSIEMSPFQDDILIINAEGDFSTILEMPFKTELVYAISKMYQKEVKRTLVINFVSEAKVNLRKKALLRSGQVKVEFKEVETLPNDAAVIKSAQSKLTVSVKPGQPASSQPAVSASPPNRGGGGSSNYGAAKTAKPMQQQQKPSNTNYNSSTPSPNCATPIQNQAKVPTQTSSRNETTNERALPKPPPKKLPVPKTEGPKCVGLWTFEPRQADELGFNVDDVIEILKEDPSGWWTGKLRNNVGIFPANYVKKL